MLYIHKNVLKYAHDRTVFELILWAHVQVELIVFHIFKRNHEMDIKI